MTSPLALLKLLQLGDSFFPSGANAFSHGLEGLVQEGRVRAVADVELLVAVQLEQRWLTGDRVALLHGHASAPDLVRLAQVDAFVDLSTPVESLRMAGRRLGRALLRTHRQLGTPLAAEYEARVRDGAPGQVSVVQGLITRAVGLSADEAAALSAYGLALGLVSAALRLGVIGHLDAQRILETQAERSGRLLSAPLPPLEDYAAFLPEAEIASMRQEARRSRLFAS